MAANSRRAGRRAVWAYTLTPVTQPCPGCGHSQDTYRGRSMYCCRGCGNAWGAPGDTTD